MMTPPTDTLDAGPPGSNGDFADSAAAKPTAWTIMQGIAGAAVPCLLVGGALLAQWLGSQAPSRATGSVEAFVFGIFASLAVWALAIYLTVRRRMPAARWVGGAFIVLLIAIGVILLADAIDARGSGDPGAALASAGTLAYLIVAFYWLYAYALSAKVKRYIGKA